MARAGKFRPSAFGAQRAKRPNDGRNRDRASRASALDRARALFAVPARGARGAARASPNASSSEGSARGGRRARWRRRRRPVEVELRRARLGLALAIALGDLAGELEPRGGHAAAVRFRRPGDRPGAGGRDRRARARRRADRNRGHRAGQAGQPRAQLFVRRRPAAAVRSRDACRGASATMPARRRCGSARRMIEILQKRTADGYVARVDLRLRPSPEVTPIALPVNAAISHYESSALCRGSGRRSSAPAPRPATRRSGSISSSRSSRSCGAARSISE